MPHKTFVPIHTVLTTASQHIETGNTSSSGINHKLERWVVEDSNKSTKAKRHNGRYIAFDTPLQVSYTTQLEGR